LEEVRQVRARESDKLEVGEILETVNQIFKEGLAGRWSPAQGLRGIDSIEAKSNTHLT